MIEIFPSLEVRGLFKCCNGFFNHLHIDILKEETKKRGKL